MFTYKLYNSKTNLKKASHLITAEPRLVLAQSIIDEVYYL